MKLIEQIKNLIQRVENDHWITIGADEEEGKKGHHVLVKDGETNKEATERKIAEWEGKETKKEEKKSEENTIKKVEYDLMPSGYVRKVEYRGSSYDAWGNGNADHSFLSKEEYEQETGKKYEDLKKQSEESKKDDKQEEKQEQPKEEKQETTDSPFGEGVEIQEHDKKGYMIDSKNLKSYRKGDKFAIVDDWSHDGKDRYTVSFHNGKKTLDRKTYSTKRGMEKAIREHLQGGDNKETKALATKTDLETAKTNYKDVLSKYKAAEKKKWDSNATPEEYHQAWVDSEKYKKELTTARREYAESIMANFETVDENSYEEKQQARRERYEELSDKARKQSHAAHQKSRDMMSAIPMGQPILVGHHSEARDRRYREKAWDKLGQGVKLGEKADYYADKAASVGKAGISADDANAIAKLAQKYKSGVTSAEKRRIIDRVIDIHTRKTDVKDTPDTSDLGFQVERNTDINRLQLKFDGKPDEKTRSILKSNGFRWSPREGAWQRQLTGNAEYSLKRISEQLKADNSLLTDIETIIENHLPQQEDLTLLSALKGIFEE